MRAALLLLPVWLLLVPGCDPDEEPSRPDAPAVLWQDDPRADIYKGASHPYPGRLDYRFDVSSGTRVLEVEFQHPLDGARVTAAAELKAASFPLFERRVLGRKVLLSWQQEWPEAHIVLSVHYHFRGAPAVVRYRTGRWGIARQ